jgi:hypothetical protein
VWAADCPVGKKFAIVYYSVVQGQPLIMNALTADARFAEYRVVRLPASRGPNQMAVPVLVWYASAAGNGRLAQRVSCSISRFMGK